MTNKKPQSFQKAAKFFKNLCQKYLQPIPRMTVSQWADKYRVVSAGSAFPGKWRTSRVPYQKEIMDAFTQSGIKKVVVMSASQIGKSDIMNNVIARFAHLDPCNIMLVQPTISTAEDYSTSRIAPMLNDTPILRKIFGTSKSRKSNNTILRKYFPGGRLVITGSNSPSELASKPMRILLFDEVDRFSPSAGTEGHAIPLTEKRQITFWNRLSGLFSSPGLKGFSRIETEYKLGTQEENRHQCPNCQEYHLLNYRDMSWQAEEIKSLDNETGELRKDYLVANVSWICPDCGQVHSEQTMKAQPQKYIAQNPEAVKNGVRSFLVNGFAPPWSSWAEIIREYLVAQFDEEELKVIVNTRFAESYEARGAIENVKPLLDSREEYGAELPEGVLLLTCAVDTQNNRLEYEVCGWAEHEECWGIEKGFILGVPDQQSTWDKLDEVLDRRYYFADGKSLKVSRTFIDSGGSYTEEVYKYCARKSHKERFAIKGSSNFDAPLIENYSKPKNYNIHLVLIGVSQGKQYVMERLQKEDDTNINRFHFPLDERRGYGLKYFKGLVAEKLVKRKSKGGLKLVWENIAKDRRNEALDLRVYNLACIRSCQINWEKYKKPQKQEAIKTAPRPEQSQEAKYTYGAVSKGIGGDWLDA